MSNLQAPEPQLRGALKPILRRLAVQHYLNWLLKGVMAGGTAALFVLLAARFFPLLDSRIWAAAFAGLTLAMAVVRAWTLRPGLWDAALAADKAGLKERAATAWQFRNLEDNLSIRQRQDALEYLVGFDLRRLGSIRPWRELAVSVALLALTVAVSFWPNPLEAETLAKRQAEQAFAAAREEVAQSLKQVKEDNKLSPEAKQAIQKQLEQLQRELAKAESLDEGNLAISKSQKELDRILSQAEQKEKLSQMAQMLQANPLTKGAGEAMSKGDKEEFQKQMEQLAAKINSLSKEEQQKLAKQMLEIASAMLSKGDNQLAQSLDKAAQALDAGQGKGSGELGEVKEQTTARMDSSGAAAALAQAMQQALGQAQKGILAAANQSKQAAMAGSKVQNGNSGSQGSGNSQSGNSGQGQNGGGSNGGSGGNGNGSGGNGSGSGSGNGSGGGGGSGGGKLGGPAGDGSTNQQGMQGGPGSNSTGGGSGTPPAKEGKYEQIYAPTRAGGSGEQSNLNGSMGSEGDSTNVDADGGLLTGSALLPYNQVFAQYESEARESVERQYFPANLKDLVRNYFLSLSGD